MAASVQSGAGRMAAGRGERAGRVAAWVGRPWLLRSASILPLITFVYGIGFTAKVFAVVLLSAPVIVLNSYRGIANAPKSLLEMSSAFLAGRWQRIWKVVIPAG